MSIYVSIAAYEDPELIDTIKSALDNAKNPDQIVFGICLQYNDEPDLSFLPKKQKRIISFDSHERPGLVRVRFLLKKMFLAEDYFLQIDSHTKFDKNWDEILINDLLELKKEKGPNSVLALQITNVLSVNVKTNTKWNLINTCPLILGHTVLANTTDENVEKYEKTQRITAGALFLDNQTLNSVDTDQYTQARNEVVYLSFCFLMNGYDIYTTTNMPISHNNRSYNEHLTNLKIEGRPFSKDHHKIFVSSFFQDNTESEFEMIKALVYNTGKFAVKSPKITIKDFWNKIGLEERYDEIKKNHNEIFYS
jgi:hypothetical protein